MRKTAVLTMMALIFLAVGAQAQVAKQAGSDSLSGLAFTSDRLVPSQPVEPLADVQSLVAPTTQNGWAAFRLGSTVDWQAAVDQRNGQVAFAEGGGIGWIP